MATGIDASKSKKLAQLLRSRGCGDFCLKDSSPGEGSVIASDLDEHLEIEGLLAGRRSGESERSFDRWLAGREQNDHKPILR
jgi:hypothetical protein